MMIPEIQKTANQKRSRRIKKGTGSNKGQGMNWCSKPKRLGIYLRDGFACVYCGAGVEANITLTLDHLAPRSRGGSNNWRNLATACKDCNDARGSLQLLVFVERFFQANTADILTRIRRFTARSKKKYMKLARKILANRKLTEVINDKKTTSQAVR